MGHVGVVGHAAGDNGGPGVGGTAVGENKGRPDTGYLVTLSASIIWWLLAYFGHECKEFHRDLSHLTIND